MIPSAPVGPLDADATRKDRDHSCGTGRRGYESIHSVQASGAASETTSSTESCESLSAGDETQAVPQVSIEAEPVVDSC